MEEFGKTSKNLIIAKSCNESPINSETKRINEIYDPNLGNKISMMNITAAKRNLSLQMLPPVLIDYRLELEKFFATGMMNNSEPVWYTPGSKYEPISHQSINFCGKSRRCRLLDLEKFRGVISVKLAWKF